MNLVFVDTGAWYAMLDGSDPEHYPVTEILLKFEGLLLTSNFVIDETITLLRYRCAYRNAVEFGEAAFSGALGRIVRVTSADENQAWSLFRQYKG